jgi:radical SAM/Cys-rich protein
MKTLHFLNRPMSSPTEQLAKLNSDELPLPKFAGRLAQLNMLPLKPAKLEIFQINLGYVCNQTCAHCHVDAGPDRHEMMSEEVVTHCLAQLATSGAHTLDITGGAPELHPQFRMIILEARKMGVAEIIVRCNLTIILSNKKFADLPVFFAENKVHVMSSLPFYKKDRTDKQRGDGVFEKSMEAMRLLNQAGYAMPNTDLKLDLVYNPSGAFLPSDQAALERDFKSNLLQEHNVHFNRLLTITNMPIARFLDYLIASDNYEDYMENLASAFNSSTVSNLMCRNTLSVGWDGELYDCDFNQMLDLKLATNRTNIRDLNMAEWDQRSIVVNQHCYGCTAGSGSSCQGAVV